MPSADEGARALAGKRRVHYFSPGDLNVLARPDLINKAGFKISQAHTGAVTLIQRFGSSLNLNLHFHMLFIDGLFSPKSNGQLRFHRVNAPTSKELNALVATISERVARYLERRGRLARVGWPETNRAII